MKILVAACAYNERKYIPYTVEYYRNQGCDFFIVDNYSTDGTYEWMIENNIPTIRVDTNESFHLKALQKVLIEEIKKIKPDWVIYTGIDIYYFFKNNVRMEIETADSLGYNMIKTHLYSAYNTGEPFLLPFPDNYFFVKRGGNHVMIAKYSDELNIVADTIYTPNPKIYYDNGFLINYGMCKPRVEREETLNRRRKAWGMGLKRGWGTHYLDAKRKGWMWDRNNLEDIRKLEDYKIMEDCLR